jgi:HSP20 family molecular chaperone IbpA
MSEFDQEFTVVKNKRYVDRRQSVTNNKTSNEILNLQRKIYSPKVDLVSCSDSFKVRIELPGVPIDTIKVEVKEQQIVLISGVRISLHEETDKVIYSETKYGNFIRRVKLPELVEHFYFNQNKCDLVNGVLYLQFQKKIKPTFTDENKGNIEMGEIGERVIWSDMI